MGIYYGEVLGVRILTLLGEEYKELWRYEGLYWKAALEAKQKEVEGPYRVEVKRELSTSYDYPYIPSPPEAFVWTHWP